MKKLHIGIITHNFPQSSADRQNAGIFVLDLAKELRKKANICVLAPGPADEIKIIDKIPTHFFKFEDKLGTLKIYNPLHILKLLKFFYIGNSAVEKFLTKNPDIDFIISMWAFPAGLFALKAFKRNKIPYAVFALGSDIYIYAKRMVLMPIIKRILLNASFLMADSPNLSQEVKMLSGKNTIFIPSASNFPETRGKLNVKSAPVVLTFLGRLEKVKGIDLFLEALKILPKEHSDFKVNIIGEGSLKTEILNFAKQNKHVKYWGGLNSLKKISTIFKNSDWLIIPSRSDSIPLVFSESMKSSLPVVAADLPDLKYLVNEGKVGMTFKTGDCGDLALVLAKIIKGKLKNSQYRRNTQIMSHKFTLKVISDKILSQIERSI